MPKSLSAVYVRGHSNTTSLMITCETNVSWPSSSQTASYVAQMISPARRKSLSIGETSAHGWKWLVFAVRLSSIATIDMIAYKLFSMQERLTKYWSKSFKIRSHLCDLGIETFLVTKIDHSIHLWLADTNKDQTKSTNRGRLKLSYLLPLRTIVTQLQP